jgi:CheY-like chemotaxis protein
VLRPKAAGLSRLPVLEHGFSVLLVDDDHHHRVPLLRALRDRGHRVLHTADGPSGETLCHASRLEIDALIACADMKCMDGFELARRLVRMRPEVRVLLMWRHLAEPEAARRAHERGHALIEEPFTLEELCRRLFGRRYALIEEPFTAEQLCHRLTGLLGVPHNDDSAESRLEDEVLAIGSGKKN